jgi:hypothetical protein
MKTVAIKGTMCRMGFQVSKDIQRAETCHGAVRKCPAGNGDDD